MRKRFIYRARLPDLASKVIFVPEPEISIFMEKQGHSLFDVGVINESERYIKRTIWIFLFVFFFLEL